MRPEWMRAVAALGLVVGLAACATAPRADTAAEGLPSLSAEMGRIVLYRPPTGMVMFMWSHLTPDVRVNGQVVGKAVPARYFVVDRPPGEYEVAVTTDTERTVDFPVRAGEVHYVRMDLESGDIRPQVVPVRVEPDTGARETARLPLAEPAAGGTPP